MNGPTRRRIQMGDLADAWNDRHPDDDAGNASNGTRLKGQLAEAHRLASDQREGFVNQQAGTARKRELRRNISEVIAHVSEAGKSAAMTQPELGMTFRHKPNTKNDLAYRTALGSMVTAAQTHRDLLVEHGLAVPMLDQLVQLVEQYDAAVTLANEGRAAHVAATLRLERLGTEIVRTVRLMNGRNRQRFQHEAKILGEWISASTVRGTPSRTPDEPETPAPAADAGTPNSGTDVRPAA